MTGAVEDLLRTAVPQVLAALLRRHGGLARCEDAVQEAALEALRAWPERGAPDDPAAWLHRAASRRLIDAVRSDVARERREASFAEELRLFGRQDASPTDDSLALVVLCCHPALTPPAQLALTLRAVGGLTTGEIARALLLPEATVAQRISRAKATIRSAGARFTLPSAEELPDRVAVVHRVLYLIFNEGWAASSGDDLLRPALTAEAIRLTRMLAGLLPGSTETASLLALMLLQDSRRATRTDGTGALVPLEEQDRRRWDAAAIEEGTALVQGALAAGPAGPYALQAAIAALHAEAPDAASTDWAQIAALYGVLARVAPSPVVELNRAVAVGEAHGAAAGLAVLDALPEGALAGHHRVDAVRAHLLERAGDRAAAAAAFRRAALGATSMPERRHLARRAAALEVQAGIAGPSAADAALRSAPSAAEHRFSTTD